MRLLDFHLPSCSFAYSYFYYPTFAKAQTIKGPATTSLFGVVLSHCVETTANRHTLVSNEPNKELPPLVDNNAKSRRLFPRERKIKATGRHL